MDEDDMKDYEDTVLPEGVSLEDALSAFMQVDPEKVQKVERSQEESDENCDSDTGE